MKHYRTSILALLYVVLGAGLHAQYSEDEWRERDEWMDVKRIFELSGIATGDRVADIGSHEGYLSMHLAAAVGPEGEILAEDISSYRLERLRKHAASRGFENIITILGDETDPKLPEGTLDIVFVVDAYHEMQKPMIMLRHFRNALKPGGRIVMLEKLKDNVRGKSRKSQTKAHSLGPEYVRKELKQAGFTIIHEVENMGNWEDNPKKKIWVIVAGNNGA